MHIGGSVVGEATPQEDGVMNKQVGAARQSVRGWLGWVWLGMSFDSLVTYKND